MSDLLDLDLESLDALFADVELTPESEAIPKRAGSSARASFGQESLWYLHQLQPTNGAYHVPITVFLEGDWRRDLLASGLSMLVERHEALRTVFRRDGERLLQDVRPPFSVDISEEIVADEVAFEVARQRFSAQPFDLAQGPLVRARLFTGARRALVISAHHAIIDAWSGDVLTRELETIYSALASGRVPLLGPVALQYGDFCEWQRTRAENGEFEPDLDFWRGRLKGVPDFALPTNYPRPAKASGRGAKVAFRLERETVERLTAVSQAQGGTLFMGLATAFQALLARYSGQSHVVFGSGIAGRARNELTGTVGLFLNNLVFDTDLSGQPDFLTALERFKAGALQAYAHGEAPFELVKRAVGANRSLFRIVFTLNESEAPVLKSEHGVLRLIDPNVVELSAAKYDLSVHCWRVEGAVEGVFEFDADLFSAATRERLVSYWQRLVAQVATQPSLKLSRVELMNDDEKRKVLVDWNATQRDLPETLFPNAFAQAVRLHPESPAVVCGTRTLSYRELDEQSTRLANHLIASGLSFEQPVAVYLTRDERLIVSFVAIQKAGGVYLPCDPGQPKERLRHMLEQAQPFTVITDGRHRAGAAEFGANLLDLDEQAAAIAEQSPRGEFAASANGLSYLIFTSGSTGKPKGVAVDHGSFAHLCHYARAQYGLNAADRGAFLTNVGFDPTLEELGAYLISGVALHVAPDELRLSPEDMKHWFLEQGITVAQMPAPVLETVLEGDWLKSSRLRLFLTGGDRLRRRPPLGSPVKVFNRYGPTEYTVYCTEQEVKAEAQGYPPIGRPIANTKIYLLDEEMKPVPLGAPGEIFVGGRGIARGYYRAPELTEARFVPNPIEPAAGLLYRTGDLARFLEDGTLEFLGRADGQVKIRGVRIEVGEVELALRAVGGVRDAWVQPCKRDGETVLVAYVVGELASCDEIRASLRGKLPEAMVPSQVIAVAALPLTANGKVDVRKLPEPVWEAPVLTEETTSGNALEQKIAAVWSEVLGTRVTRMQANFFDLGGHSLLLASVQTKLRAQGLETTLVELLLHPSVAALARHLESRAAGGPSQPIKTELSDAKRRAQMRANVFRSRRQ